MNVPGKETAVMAEAIPRLAVAMRSVLPDAQIQAMGFDRIDVRFNGIPAWRVCVVRKIINNQYQMLETQIDLMPLCIASLPESELQRLAAVENLGLRGVTVLPLIENGRGGLRIQTSFKGQKGRTRDEVENLAIDILTVITFARTLEDRLTDCSVAGEFSYELYTMRHEPQALMAPTRFITHGQNLFTGSQDRVFHEVLKSLQTDFHFDVRVLDQRLAMIKPPGTNLEVIAKIPNEIPIFSCYVPLLKVGPLRPNQIWSLLAELNKQSQGGHFELNVNDRILAFAAWKHLTNDLRLFSFDHVIFSMSRALELALDTLQGSPVESPAKDAGLSEVLDHPFKRAA